MKKKITICLVVPLFLFVSLSAAFAGGRYNGYGSSYNHHHFTRYSHHHRGYHYDSSYVWAQLGIGLLTGLFIATVANQPRRDQITVYHQPAPVTQYRQTPVYSRLTMDSPQQELVLRRVKATAPILNVRSLPGLDSPVANQVSLGTHLDVIGAAPDWLYIKTPSGQYGWVRDVHTTMVAQPSG